MARASDHPPASPALHSPESPLRLAFWLGDVDPRPLALFRVGFGLALLHDLFDLSVDLRAFLTDEGLLPRGAQAEPRAWTLFDLVGSQAAVAALFALGVLVVVAFTLGFHTRLATALSLLFLTSVHNRNLYVVDGGDDLVRILLFLCLFTDLGRAWSLDVRLGRKVRGPAPALGLRALQLHLALLYFVAARLKFRQRWLTTNPIYQVLQLDGFTRPPGKLLMRSPLLCRLSGVAVVAMEWLFGFFAFSPWKIPIARALAILCGVGVQLGILLTMRVGVFTEVLLVSNALLLQPAWLDRLEARWSKQPTPPATSVQSGSPASLTTPLRIAGAAVLAFYFASSAWGPFIGSRVKEPWVLTAPRRWLWLEQPFGLFDVVYDVPLWSAPGVQADGTLVDVLEVAEPHLIGKVGVGFSRWYKFTFKERERPFRLPELGRYLCRAYEEKTGARLRSFTLVETLTPPSLPGQPAGPARHRDLLRQECADVPVRPSR